MNSTGIPEKTRIEAAKLYKKNPFIGHHATIPVNGIEVITSGKGIYKAGLRGWIIGGHERIVFLGDEKKGQLIETKLPEFTIVMEGGYQFLGQYERDFRFAN